jgi:hypothetical protein
MIARQLRPLLVPLLVTCASAQSVTPHLFFRVTLSSGISGPASGRLLVFLQEGSGATEIRVSELHPSATFVAASEISDVEPGSSVDIDVDQLAFPAPFSSLKPGTYQAQAVLDVNHTYAYDGLQPGDMQSKVMTLTNWTPASGVEPTFVLDHTVPPGPERNPPLNPDVLAMAEKSLRPADFTSPALTAFSGRDIHIRAWVVLPPGYAEHPQERYPTVYWTHGFGAGLDSARLSGLMIYSRMADGKMPPMIWVMLDESLPTGTHEFADSVNNGPWGQALTQEFVPWVESKYRMDARVNGRFLNGHSSGGWATLQLQINYPRIFGGTWSTSPDPSDFHAFSPIDLYAPHANMYHDPDGKPYPIIRDHDKTIVRFEDLARLEEVMGEYGGQIASFEWVFSPRAANGKPLQLFDRKTGYVHPEVVAYWRDHYDLANIVSANWSSRGRDLRGKIHVIVGTADTFFLDGAAHRLDAVVQKLHGDGHFTFRENRTHFDLYEESGDRMALMDEIAEQMYAVARPAVPWKRPAGAPAPILQ